MKKIFILLCVLCALSSCKKDWICTVEWDMKTGWAGNYSHFTHNEEILNSSQSEAEMRCNEVYLQKQLDVNQAFSPTNGTYSVH